MAHTTLPVALRRQPAIGSRHVRGYTLVELMVVMVLLGIAAGAVTLSVAPSEERRATDEFERLGALFRIAQDDTRITGRTLTWEADAAGYRFRSGETVLGAAGDEALRPRFWPFAVSRIDAPAVVFGREPLLDPTRFEIVAPTRAWRVAIDALGRVSVLP